MKGILKNTPAGWFVWYQVMRDEITSGYDSIPLHPKYEKYYFLDDDASDGEVEFEIVNYDGKTPISEGWSGYAKLKQLNEE
jgi:hypothetical protein